MSMSTNPVWVLTIDHKHGSDKWIAINQEEAHDWLADWCRQWWAHEIGAEPMPADDGALIDSYFATMNDRGEYYSIDECGLGVGP